uniref:Uncharacterized protein n=1 Tax=Arundo donax TaxID=35708 RepID=A0A0A8YFM1_ARUDO
MAPMRYTTISSDRPSTVRMMLVMVELRDRQR